MVPQGDASGTRVGCPPAGDQRYDARRATRGRQKDCRMTSLQDCLEEVIARGAGYCIRSDAPGAYRSSQWEPAVLLADMQHEAPNTLQDHAWTEWSALRDGSATCSIHYGVKGVALGHMGVPGYGHLRAFVLSQKQPEYSHDAGAPLERLLGHLTGVAAAATPLPPRGGSRQASHA